jgi:hypothetical protein
MDRGYPLPTTPEKSDYRTSAVPLLHLSGKRVYQALARDKTLNKFVKSRGIRTGGTKERGAWQPRKRLLYCVNVNRTSLDHLLLGRNADVDKNVD